MLLSLDTMQELKGPLTDQVAQERIYDNGFLLYPVGERIREADVERLGIKNGRLPKPKSPRKNGQQKGEGNDGQ